MVNKANDNVPWWGSKVLLRKMLAGLLIVVPVGMVPLPVLGAEGAAPDDEQVKGAMYRYRNSDGIQVIDFTIPPEYADKGYDILAPSGRLIKRIPKRSEISSQSVEELKAREEQEKLDAYILRSYSSLEDVGRAKNRRLQLVEREIDVLKSNLMEYSRREAEVKERAASYQASGQAPPESVTQVLAELEAQKLHASQQLAERQAQFREVVDRYKRHASRLKELRPELGGSASAANVSEKSPPQ